MNGATLIIIVSLCYLTFFCCEHNALATSSLLDDFNSNYGDSLAAVFSCSICHLGDMTLNPYGEDLAEAGGSSCGKFLAPDNHNILESSSICTAYHREGYKKPFSSNCWGCHGKDLKGENSPSCYTCHDQLWQVTSRTRNPKFDPPGSHTINESEDGINALHAPGFKSPYSSGCQNCHGYNLRGGTGPSCYTCHGNEWDENDDDSEINISSGSRHYLADAETFRSIESLDSDGDGFSNIEEINALSNPGDFSSIPGNNDVEVNTNSNWKIAWLTKKGRVQFTITFLNGHSLDPDKPLKLISDYGEFEIVELLKSGKNSAKFRVSKSLLSALVADFSTGKEVMFLSGWKKDGSRFKTPFAVNVIGKQQSILPNVKTKYKGDSAAGSQGLEIIAKATDLKKKINIAKGFYVSGFSGIIEPKDYKLKAGKLIFNLTPENLEKISGHLLQGFEYPLAIFAEAKNDKILLILTSFTAGNSGGGGGGDTCYDYSPPASHTQAKTKGNCSYLHAPGFASPISSGCNSCHGSNLEGSSFAPSCTVCHNKNW